MAVGLRIKLAGLNVEEFDKLDAAVNVRDDHPDGLIFSASGPIDGGWGLIDFWDSREQFDRFLQERVAPAAQATGTEAQPEIREFPVHEYVSR